MEKSNFKIINEKFKRLTINVPSASQEKIINRLWEDEFTDKFPFFECQICLSFVIEPVNCGNCETIFCKFCISKYSHVSNSICPNRCNLIIKPIHRTLKNILNDVRINCPFRFKGCNEKLRYEIYSKHLNECEYGPYMCLARNCLYVDVKTKITTHCKICDYFAYDEFESGYGSVSLPFECFYCKNIINNEEAFLIHVYLCEKQILLCKICNTKMTLKEFKNHNNFYNDKDYDSLCIINKYENKIKSLQDRLDYYIKLEENKFIYSNSKIGFEQNNENKLIINNCINLEILDKKMFLKNEFLTNAVIIDSKVQNFHNSGISISSKSIKVIKRNKQTNFVIHFPNILGIFSLGNKQLDFFNIENLNKLESKNFENFDTEKFIITYLTFLEVKSNEQEKEKYVIVGTQKSGLFIFKLDDNLSIIRKREIKFYSSINFVGYYCSTSNKTQDTYLLVSGIYSNLFIFNFFTGEKIAELSHRNKSILSFAYLNESNLLITSTKDSNIRVWEEEIIQREISFSFREFLKDHSDSVWVLSSFSTFTSNIVASGSADRKIIIWEFPHNKSSNAIKKFEITGHNDSVTVLANLKILNLYLLISGSYDGEIKIWKINNEISTGENIYSVFSHKEKINSISVGMAKTYNNTSEILLISDSEDSSIILNTLILINIL